MLFRSGERLVVCDVRLGKRSVLFISALCLCASANNTGSEDKSTARKADDSSWRAGESIDRAIVRDYPLPPLHRPKTTGHYPLYRLQCTLLAIPLKYSGHSFSPFLRTGWEKNCKRTVICLADGDCYNSTPFYHPTSITFFFKPN